MLPLLLLASLARAEPLTLAPAGGNYLSVGPLFSVTGRSGEAQLGLGVEATFNVVENLTATGGFAQAEVLGDGHARLCGGVQATHMFVGVELGLMHETGTRSHVATTGLHIAPYLAFVFGSVGVRFGIPLTEPGATGPGGQRRPRYGGEAGLVLTLKVPFELGGMLATPMAVSKSRGPRELRH